MWEEITGSRRAAQIFNDYAAHDKAHIGDPMRLGFYYQLMDKHTLSDHQKEIADRFVTRAPDVLRFREYPDKMFIYLLGQHLGVSPYTRDVDMKKQLETMALALALRVPGVELPFGSAEFSADRVQDPNFTGLLYQVENGLQINTVEPYLISILYNILKNPWKAFVENPVLHQGVPFNQVAGFKLVVVARRHPKFPDLATIEIIDNGMGFDLNRITKEAVKYVTQSPEATQGLLPQNLVERLRKMATSPYASNVLVSEIQYAIFLHRLSGFDPDAITSGLGLWGARNLATQLREVISVGSNQPGMAPFDRGARFMITLPIAQNALVPVDTSILATDLSNGDNTTPWFTG